jgi:hypothetical protein
MEKITLPCGKTISEEEYKTEKRPCGTEEYDGCRKTEECE